MDNDTFGSNWDNAFGKESLGRGATVACKALPFEIPVRIEGASATLGSDDDTSNVPTTPLEASVVNKQSGSLAER